MNTSPQFLVRKILRGVEKCETEILHAGVTAESCWFHRPFALRGIMLLTRKSKGDFCSFAAVEIIMTWT